MFLTKRMLGLVAVCMLGAFLGASQAAPTKVVPGSTATDDYLYVFGPQAAPGNGKDDCLQIVFFEYAASVPSVDLYIWDPGSGKRFERSFTFKGFFRDTKTRFSVYGGKGAYSALASRSVRPQATQPGKELSTVVYDTNAPEGWVSLGTFKTSDAEVIDGTAYLKLVVQGIDGDGANFFKVGISDADAEIFSFDITLHLATEEDSRMEFKIPVAAGSVTFEEANYDLDTNNIATLAGRPLKSSKSGEWVTNTVTIADTGGELLYHIIRGTRGFSNAGFHVSTSEGDGLPIYFSSTIMPSVPQEPPPEPITATDGQIDTSLLTLTKRMPSGVAMGQEFAVTLLLHAKTSIGNVVVTDTMPDGLTLVSSDPPAKVDGKTLTWTFDRLAAGEEKQINMVCRATGVATLENCVTVKADPLACTVTKVGTPVLTIEKTGPAQAALNSVVRYQITVKNTGDIAATNVVVKDAVPEGMTHESGTRELTFNVGTLAPGESKTMFAPLKAVKRGECCNKAVVTSGNAKEATSSACTTVVESQLKVVKKGPERQYIGKTAAYTMVVSNPGDLPLTNVIVTDTAPEGTRIVSADGAKIEGNVAVWKLATLKAGAKQEYGLVLTSREPGTRINNVAVTTAEGLTGKSSAPTLWEGYAALLIEVVDSRDPLQPGEETTYIISITNQGTASDRNVKLKVLFPDELTPLSSEGDVQGTITGKVLQTIIFPEIKPKQNITLRLKARADKIGDGRVSVELTSELLQKAVTEEESTQVY